MANTIYTQAQFDSFKNQIISGGILRKRVTINEIQIISDTVIKYAGLTFKLDPAAFKSLLGVLGVSKQLRNKMIKDFGKNFTEKLIEVMGARTEGSKAELIMIVNANTKTVVNFAQANTVAVGDETYLGEIEKVIGNYGLQITDMVRRQNGGFSISTLAPNSEWGLSGMKDEVFKFGLNFENDPVKGTRLSPFNQRLICTNGMTTTQMMGSTKLIGNKESWEHFFSTINQMDKNGFRPNEFAKSVKGSMNVQASLAEVEGARNLILANTTLEPQTLETYLPYQETVYGYAKNDLDVSLFNADQKRNAKTATTYWDLINDITYISSNVSGIGLKNPDTLQMYAGRLLSKTPDCSNIVTSPF